MRATAAASVVRSAAMLVVMLVLGTPFAGPLSVVLLVGGLIPYLGVLVSTLAIVLVALGGQGFGPAVLVFAAAVGIEGALTSGVPAWKGRLPSASTRPSRSSRCRSARSPPASSA